MKIRFAGNLQVLFIAAVLLAPTPLCARAKTDVITMNNGDRITCEVKGLDGGVLSIGIDYVDGTISVDWLKVVRLESTQLFVVLTQDGSSYEGTLSTIELPAAQPMKIRIGQAPEDRSEIERSQIVKVSQTSEKFYRRFNGSINLGITYSKGNSATQYNFGTEAQYLRERWSAEATYNSNLSSSTGATTSTRNQFNLDGYHFLRWDNYFYGGQGGFMQSSVQGIKLQTTIGGGIGHFFKNTNRTSIALLAGFGWQSTDYEQSATPQERQNVGAALFAGQVKFFKFSKSNFEVKANLLPALSDPGRLRFDMNASYYLKLFSNLNWNVTFYGDWDNRPPPGFTGSDYGTTSGVSWTFGNR